MSNSLFRSLFLVKYQNKVINAYFSLLVYLFVNHHLIKYLTLRFFDSVKSSLNIGFINFFLLIKMLNKVKIYINFYQYFFFSLKMSLNFCGSKKNI